MIIEKIKLTNFRNYKKIDLTFNKGLNLFYGSNGSGKTNLVEAIYFLSLTRSFRTSETEELIKKDASFARILAKIDTQNVSKTLEISFNKSGKKILVNGKKVLKISELNSLINVISFIPKNTNLLKDAPKERRKFLNIYLSKFSNNYLKTLSVYEKILKERNDAFKAYKINPTLIDILTNQLISLNKEIYLYRKKFVNEINKYLADVFKEVSLTNEKLKMEYESFLNNQNENIENFLKNEFENIKEEEFKRKQTLIGIHKDDFKIYIDEKDVSLYGSQGENRISIISLILSLYFLNKEEKPIIVLDDVISELDEKHEENLLKYLENFNQVFITNTAKSQFFTGNYYHLINKELKEE